MKPRAHSFANGDALWERATRSIPLGTQTFSKAPNQFALGLTPKFLDRGVGSHVWDVDGNEFIDYVMACQPVVLGYCDPDVDAAIVDQLRKGIVMSLPTRLEVEVAERVIDAVPCAEGVRFGKNGADATTAAVRIARAVTGRNHIAYAGYHGWHDWYIANTDLNSGIPQFNKELSHAFTFNDLGSLERIFDDYPEQIAVVILEPLQVAEPKDNFLHGVKELTHANGALLVFDEIVTGFRFAFGGAQQLVGVTPDLACFGKAISNGMPLSVITGKKEYLWALEKTFFSFTYGGEALSLAAAKATIDKIKRENVINHLWRIGAKLKDGVNAIASRHNLSDTVSCEGYPCRPITAFKGNGRFEPLELKTLFQQEMIKRGVLFGGYHSLCLAHSDADIEATLEAYDEAFKILRKVADTNRSILDVLEVPVVQPVFRKVADFMAQTVRGR